MELEIKYYKFIDPINGVQSKGIGWVVNKKGWFVAVKEVEGKAVITRNDPIDQVMDYKPRFGTPEEITKKEYDELNTFGESQKVIIRRENDIDTANKLLKRAASPDADASPADKMKARMEGILEEKKIAKEKADKEREERKKDKAREEHLDVVKAFKEKQVASKA